MDQEDAVMLELDGHSSGSSESGGTGQRGAAGGSAGASAIGRADMSPEQTVDARHRRFRVRKWTAIALWAYDISVDNCAICRNHIMDKCIECQSTQEARNVDGGECRIAWGRCSHVFHMHCILRWLNTRQVCPLDNRNWELKKVGN